MKQANPCTLKHLAVKHQQHWHVCCHSPGGLLLHLSIAVQHCTCCMSASMFVSMWSSNDVVVLWCLAEEAYLRSTCVHLYRVPLVLWEPFVRQLPVLLGGGIQNRGMNNACQHPCVVGALCACRDCGVQEVHHAVCLGTAPACLQSNPEMFCMSAYAKYGSHQPPVGLHIRSFYACV